MIIFYLSEVYRAIRKAKFAFFISLITSCISVLFISISLFLLIFSNIVEEKVKEKAVMNVFLHDSLEEITSLQINLQNTAYFSRITYINKESAEKKFLKETGQDFKKILEYNPLPASFEVVLQPQYISEKRIDEIKEELSNISGVDEVVFENNLLFKIINSFEVIKFYIFCSSIILLLISLYLVYSTNKLIVNAKSAQIQTMKLVGAKISAIKIPLVIYGLTIGVIASIISLVILNVLGFLFKDFQIFSLEFSEIWFFYSIIYLSGPMIGLLGSIFATARISLKVTNK